MGDSHFSNDGLFSQFSAHKIGARQKKIRTHILTSKSVQKSVQDRESLSETDGRSRTRLIDGFERIESGNSDCSLIHFPKLFLIVLSKEKFLRNPFVDAFYKSCRQNSRGAGLEVRSWQRFTSQGGQAPTSHLPGNPREGGAACSVACHPSHENRNCSLSPFLHSSDKKPQD